MYIHKLCVPYNSTGKNVPLGWGENVGLGESENDPGVIHGTILRDSIHGNVVSMLSRE